MARAPRPPLYRAARWVGLVATLVAVVLVLYVAATVYSATRVRPDLGGGNPVSLSSAPGGVDLHVALNFSNPGFLPISGVALAAIVDTPGNTSEIARGQSPGVAIPAGGTVVVPLMFLIPFASGSPLAAYVTHDAELPTSFWANVTVSSFFDVSVHVANSFHWGAPFADLNVTLAGTPSASNGTLAVPIAIAFQDHSDFPLTGTLNFTLQNSAGCAASLPSIPLNVAAGSSFSQTVTATAPTSCAANGGWHATGGLYRSSDWTVAIPGGSIP